MKRRKFLVSSLGFVGLMGIGASGSVVKSALAQGHSGHVLSPLVDDLQLIGETVDDNFKYNGHRVQILRRAFRHSKKPSSQTERWVMKFNGKELPERFFTRLDSQGCYFSEQLPFQDHCQARDLAKALVDGHNMKLFLLN